MVMSFYPERNCQEAQVAEKFGIVGQLSPFCVLNFELVSPDPAMQLTLLYIYVFLPLYMCNGLYSLK